MTKLNITKTNIIGDKEIEGAKMQIVDDEGNVVEEWTSSDKPHFIEGKLTAGKRYTLHEESAPDGYVVAADIQFTVSDGGIIDAVLMNRRLSRQVNLSGEPSCCCLCWGRKPA